MGHGSAFFPVMRPACRKAAEVLDEQAACWCIDLTGSSFSEMSPVAAPPVPLETIAAPVTCWFRLLMVMVPVDHAVAAVGPGALVLDLTVVPGHDVVVLVAESSAQSHPGDGLAGDAAGRGIGGGDCAGYGLGASEGVAGVGKKPAD